MKSMLCCASLISLATLLGCALPSSPNFGTIPNGSWTNWQIQAGTAITSPPNTYPSFAGAIQVQGTAVSATLVTIDSIATSSPQTYAGTYNATTGAITFSPSGGVVGGASLSFTPPTSPYAPTNVSGNIFCGVCNVIAPFTGVGVQIAPLTGTYVGTLTESNSPSLSGTATLVLSQTATPNSSGQFPLSGTIALPSGSGFGTVPLGGTVAGEGIALSDSSAAPNSPTCNVTAAASPDGTHITVSNLLYSNFGPGAVFNFTGTLTRQ